MAENFKLARARMAIIASIIGEFIGGFIAILFYWTFFVPFALIARTTSDPLQRKAANRDYWQPRDPVPTDLDSAKKQG